jgi:integrase
MKTHNPENERTKRDYFGYLKNARGLNETSIDAAAKAIARFEASTRYKSFKAFHYEQANAFKRQLAAQVGERSGAPLSKSTLRQTFAALKSFFEWLAGQSGFRSKFTYTDAAYFNLALKDATIARATRETRVPTLEQVQRVLDAMPIETEVEQRNRAMVALSALTAARANALASMRLKHVDLKAGRIVQDARQVRTKFSKSFPTYFVPIGGNALAIVEDWVNHLQRERLWGPDDPLFPATRVDLDANRQFASTGLDRKCWRGSAAVRKIFRDAFASAGLPYSNPRAFRDMLARFGEQTCRTPEDFKAFSQNIGHDKVLTTFTSYGEVPTERQAQIVRSLKARKADAANDSKLMADLAALVSRHAGA